MDRTERAEQWVARRRVAASVRLGSRALPLALALATGVVASRLYGEPQSLHDALLRVVVTGGASVMVLAASDRAARRLLPLAALYGLTLAFPDRAPSRFAIALRAGNSKQLERRIEAAKRGEIEPVHGQSYFETLLELVAALNGHDRLTRGHCERTRALTEVVIDELGLPASDADPLRWAALLHDVGKLGVDADILNKAGRPTDDEWEQLRAHPEIGATLAAPIAEYLGPWMSAISQHHERWDGGGYPAGLAGTDIHLGGRIVAVTDAFDVMTSARSYKKPISREAARAELVRCAGTQFDPEVVRAFLTASLGRRRRSVAGAGPLVHVRELVAVLAPTPIPGTLGGAFGAVAASTGAAALAVAMVVGQLGFAADEPVALTRPPAAAPEAVPAAARAAVGFQVGPVRPRAHRQGDARPASGGGHEAAPTAADAPEAPAAPRASRAASEPAAGASSPPPPPSPAGVPAAPADPLEGLAGDDMGAAGSQPGVTAPAVSEAVPVDDPAPADAVPAPSAPAPSAPATPSSPSSPPSSATGSPGDPASRSASPPPAALPVDDLVRDPVDGAALPG